MKQVINYAPSHSLFIIFGSGMPDVPDCIAQQVALWSTPSCIAVCGRMWQEAETELTLSDDPGDIKLETPTFDGMLDTPLRRTYVASAAEIEILVECDVPHDITRVRIWTDHPREPDNILVVLG